MATKSEMIDFITANLDYDKNELEFFNYKKVKKIYDSTELIDAVVPKEEIDWKSEDSSNIEQQDILDKLLEGVDTNIPDELPLIKEAITKAIIEDDATAPDFDESSELNKKIIDKGFDIKSLSPVQKRSFARSGIIPKKK